LIWHLRTATPVRWCKSRRSGATGRRGAHGAHIPGGDAARSGLDVVMFQQRRPNGRPPTPLSKLELATYVVALAALIVLALIVAGVF